MNTLTLLTAPDCHLCAHAREVLDALAAEGLLRWRELDANSAEGARLAAAAPPLRPVLFDATGHVIAYGRLSQRRLLRELSDPPPRASCGRSAVVDADATRIPPAYVGNHQGSSR